MKAVLTLVCILFFCWFSRSCTRNESFSAIPEIHFKELVFEERTDSLGTMKKAILTFSFVDGDGDLGARPAGAGNSNILYTWQKKQPDMTYLPYYFDTLTTIKSSIPYDDVMDKDNAQNKVLKGTIQIGLSLPMKTQGIDTMRIEFYITDRAKNSSNIEHTPDFSIQNTPNLVK